MDLGENKILALLGLIVKDNPGDYMLEVGFCEKEETEKVTVGQRILQLSF